MADRIVSASRVVKASPEAIFDLLADPSRHSEIDGSGMVQGARGEPQRLALGSKFGMDMKMGPVPYRMTSTVVEFEENRLIAWQHFGKHRWRYVLEPVTTGDGDDAQATPATEVTESFDWSTALWPKGIELMGYPKQHEKNIAETLERLAAAVE